MAAVVTTKLITYVYRDALAYLRHGLITKQLTGKFVFDRLNKYPKIANIVDGRVVINNEVDGRMNPKDASELQKSVDTMFGFAFRTHKVEGDPDKDLKDISKLHEIDELADEVNEYDLRQAILDAEYDSRKKKELDDLAAEVNENLKEDEADLQRIFDNPYDPDVDFDDPGDASFLRGGKRKHKTKKHKKRKTKRLYRTQH
jgi:hypothetical protein